MSAPDFADVSAENAAVLAEFITRVLRQCPRATHVISAVILNNAIAHARVSQN